jgi:hypothetical protein
MYESILVRLRSHAARLVALAPIETQRAQRAKEYAECVLRNRAKLVAARLQQTDDPKKRQKILSQALLLA